MNKFILSKKMKNILFIFMLLGLLTLSSISSTIQDNDSSSGTSSTPGTNSSDSSANALSESRCYLDTVGNNIAKMQERVDRYSSLCNLDSIFEIKTLIAFADSFGAIEGKFLNKTMTGDDRTNFYNQWGNDTLPSSFNSAEDLTEYDFNSVLTQTKVYLTNFGTANNHPSFYIDNVWKLFKFTRATSLFKNIYADLSACLILDQTSYDIAFDLAEPQDALAQMKPNTMNFDEYRIQTSDFDKRGVAIAFWSYQETRNVTDTDGKLVMQAFKNNKKLMDVNYFRGKDISEIVEKLTFDLGTYDFKSTSSGPNLVFYLFGLEKDCDFIKATAAMRLPVEDVRHYFDSNKNASFIENLQVNVFKPAVVAGPFVYTDYVHSPSEEDRIMMETSKYVQDLLLKLKKAKNDKPKECAYFVDGQCIKCIEGLFLYKNVCVAVCPATTYPKEGNCEPCIDNCKTCSNGSVCEDCNEGFLLIKKDGTCTTACPQSTVQVERECVNCPETCLDCASPSQCTT
jgi:hypothetical protein